MAVNSFQQQGQFDWGHLGGFTLISGRDFVARCERKGISPNTVLSALQLCTAFVFPADGQAELARSLEQIPRMKTLQRFLWYGIGHKSILFELLETQQGAGMIAMSAAFTSYGGPNFAARVWEQLFLLKGPQEGQSPSILQWQGIVTECAASLQRSSFNNHYNEFSRILAPGASASRSPVSPQELAKALVVLWDLSRTPNSGAVVFVGGVECALLAAVAKCLLRLSIEVVNEADNRWYKWPSEGAPVQAMFWPTTSDNKRKLSAGSVRYFYQVPSGADLLHHRVDMVTPTVQFYRQWTSVFASAFPSSWSDFLQSSCAGYCAELLQLVAYCAQNFFSASSRISPKDPDLPWWLYWHPDDDLLFHPRRVGRELLDFVRETLPELCDLPHVGPNNLAGHSHPLKALQGLEQKLLASCSCELCTGRQVKGQRPRSDCFKRFALTIVRIALVLSPVTIDANIPLLPHTVRQMYNCCVEPASLPSSQALPLYGVDLILYLFTGYASDRGPGQTSPRATAACFRGTCVYLTMMTELNLPIEHAIGIEVIPGQIQYKDCLYRRLIDILDSNTRVEDVFSSTTKMRTEGFNPTVELIVEELDDGMTLAASYKSAVSEAQIFLIKPGEIQRHLRSELRFHLCICRESPGMFPTGDIVYRWSVRKDSSRNSEPDENGQFWGASKTSYFMLDWNAWQPPNRNARHHFEVDVYRGDLNWIICLRHLLVQERRRRGGGITSGISIIPTCCGVDCVGRVMISNWLREFAAIANSKNSDRILRIRENPRITSMVPQQMVVRVDPLRAENEVGCFTMEVSWSKDISEKTDAKKYSWDSLRFTLMGGGWYRG